MRRIRGHRSRPLRLVGVFAFLAIGFAVPPAVGLGSPTRGGYGAQQPQGVEISHRTPVKPKHFRGDVRKLPKLKPPKSKHFEPPEAPETGFDKPAPSGPAAPTQTPLVSIPGPSSSFKGLDFNSWGAGWPPDTVGESAPNPSVQAATTSTGIFSKTGTQLAAFTFDSLWAAAGTGTYCDNSNGGDPTVIYDPMGDRWIVADFAFSDPATPPFYECIAVSKTSDPVTGGWYLYAIRADDGAHPFFPDYPKMGIWPDGLYMTANMFQGNSFQEVAGWAFNRADLESGAPVRTVVFDMNTPLYFGMLPGNLRGAAPPAGRDELLVSESLLAFSFEVFKFHPDYDGSCSSVTGPTHV